MEDIFHCAAGGRGTVRLDLDDRRFWKFPVKLGSDQADYRIHKHCGDGFLAFFSPFAF